MKLPAQQDLYEDARARAQPDPRNGPRNARARASQKRVRGKISSENVGYGWKLENTPRGSGLRPRAPRRTSKTINIAVHKPTAMQAEMRRGMPGQKCAASDLPSSTGRGLQAVPVPVSLKKFRLTKQGTPRRRRGLHRHLQPAPIKCRPQDPTLHLTRTANKDANYTRDFCPVA